MCEKYPNIKGSMWVFFVEMEPLICRCYVGSIHIFDAHDAFLGSTLLAKVQQSLRILQLILCDDMMLLFLTSWPKSQCKLKFQCWLFFSMLVKNVSNFGI